MDVTTPIAGEPERDEPRAEGAPSTNSQTPDSKRIMSTESDGESSAPLGTPRERLQILEMEIRNSALAGLPVRFDFRKTGTTPENYVSTLVIVVPNVSKCPACGWWRFDEICDNRRCALYQSK